MTTAQGSSSVSSSVILGFDPGRDKCGVAVVGTETHVYLHEVVLAQEVTAKIQGWIQQYAISTVVMGNQTTAKQWQQMLEQSLPDSIEIVLIDERYSTLEARNRYWDLYPPQGLLRLMPKGMREVPRPIDDIVAIILVERYLEGASA
jgi:RNase H-fold protein (predicted Holliday junction resolvase)